MSVLRFLSVLRHAKPPSYINILSLVSVCMFEHWIDLCLWLQVNSLGKKCFASD